MKCVIFIRKDSNLMSVLDKIPKAVEICALIFKDRESFPDDYKNLKKKYDIISHNEFLEKINIFKDNKIDYIFSYFYQRKIENSILDIAKKGGINVHPAPLPYYRGVGTYALCILEELDFWAVSAHYMDSDFDNGKIIKVNKFLIDKLNETYSSLEEKTRMEAQKLFIFILENAILDTIKIQENIEEIDSENIKYLSRKKISEMKLISLDDTIDIINKKIRAFWAPPFSGAILKIGTEEYTLVNKVILEKIKKGEEI
jgi:methionyl-tRNA formyltransferase